MASEKRAKDLSAQEAAQNDLKEIDNLLSTHYKNSLYMIAKRYFKEHGAPGTLAVLVPREWAKNSPESIGAIKCSYWVENDLKEYDTEQSIINLVNSHDPETSFVLTIAINTNNEVALVTTFIDMSEDDVEPIDIEANNTQPTP